MDIPAWESRGKFDKLMKVVTDALFSTTLKYNQPNELAYSVSCSFINVILSDEHAWPEGQLDPVPTPTSPCDTLNFDRWATFPNVGGRTHPNKRQ